VTSDHTTKEDAIQEMSSRIFATGDGLRLSYQ